VVLRLPGQAVPVALLASALYLAGFFVSQLRVEAAPRTLGRAVSFGVALAALVVERHHLDSVDLVLVALLLAVTPLVDEAVSARAGWNAAAVPIAAALTAATLWVALAAQGVTPHQLALLALVAYVIASATAAYRRSESERRDGAERYGALLSEYRQLKRVAAGSADAARAEERISVARRLHDSVGQRLTSLLLQLEVERLSSATDEQRRRATELKRLAQLSLDETREAVSALSEGELAGMPALLRLIHNLEVESAMHIEFTIGSGAMSVRLDQEPAVALYRAVQEALTNAMRHGSSRRATVSVEVPAGRLLRFEVVNDVGGTLDAAPAGASFRPGFGLSSMRDRVEAAGGQLEVIGGHGKFLVRGSFPIEAR